MWIMILFFVAIAIFIGVFILAIALILKALTEERNPNNCYVFPYYENTLNKPIKGIKLEKTSNGIRYKYKNNIIDIPITYPVIWHKKRRTLFINSNRELITKFDNGTKNFNFTADNLDDLQFELGTTNLITQAIKSMKGGNDIVMIIIAIVIFVVGAVIGYGVGKMTTKSINNQSIVTTTIPATITTPKIITTDGITIKP